MDIKILSIDAWRGYEGGWTWNASYKIGIVDPADLASLDTPRKVAAYLRREGYLSEYSKGRIAIDMGGCYADTLIEIQDKNTREPLFAISACH